MRFQGRFLTRQSILNAVDGFELIESYPDDKYLPSYLVHGQAEGMVFHVLLAGRELLTL